MHTETYPTTGRDRLHPLSIEQTNARMAQNKREVNFDSFEEETGQ